MMKCPLERTRLIPPANTSCSPFDQRTSSRPSNFQNVVCSVSEVRFFSNKKNSQTFFSLSCSSLPTNELKTVPCSKTCAHDWTVCPYAHCGEIARRRDLKMFSYSAIPCADYQKVPTSRAKARGKGSHEYSCPRGANCPYAHGIFESWLHPSRYRTQLCKDGLGCTRKACFFAHKAKELRSVASDNINADSNNNYNSNMSLSLIHI